MRVGGVKIGKVFGIELWLDYSWFVLFFLIAATFTLGLLPAQFPDLSPPAVLLTGLAITLLFFGSVIAHELSHSFYAKSKGLEIRRITLFIFGGAAEIADEPRSPGQEFVMAAVGPLSSLGLGVLFGAFWILGEQIAYLPLIAVGSTLAVINVVLAVFNVLPGFPMDGGRMFRAAAWKLTGDLEKATRYAAAGGRLMGFALVFLGLYQLLFAGLIGGLWLILIGFFLSQAAAFSYQQTVSRLLLKDVQVKDLMRRDFVAVPRSTTIRDFFQKYVLRYKETTLPIRGDKTHPAGIIDAKQLPMPATDEKVGEFVTEGGYVLRPQDTAIKALDMMAEAGLAKLPVSEDGKLVGVLTSGQIRAYLLGKDRLRSKNR